MPCPAPPPVTASAADAAGLPELQLRVARRADELTRRFRASPAADRRLWLRAEFEAFERLEAARPHAVSHAP